VSKKLTMEIDAPWSKTKFDLGDFKSFIKQGLEQLEYFRDVLGNETEHLKRDIEGYKMILNSSDPQSNGAAFMEVKRGRPHPNGQPADNLAVIDIIKAEGGWIK